MQPERTWKDLFSAVTPEQKKVIMGLLNSHPDFKNWTEDSVIDKADIVILRNQLRDESPARESTTSRLTELIARW
jgi:hypothetical protein